MQLTQGQNIPLPTTTFTIHLQPNPVGEPIATHAVLFPNNESGEPATVLSTSSTATRVPGICLAATDIEFDLTRTRGIQRIVVLLASHGTVPLITLIAADASDCQLAEFSIPKSEGDTAALACEVYLRQERWRIRAVGQGYQNGITAAASDLGFSAPVDPPHLESVGAAATLDDARRAVEGLAQASRTRPEVLPDLATALVDLTRRLDDDGHDREAADTSERAVGILAKLAADRPGEFEGSWAIELCNLGVYLYELERFDAALGYARQAVEILERLAASDPDRYLGNLATALSNLSFRFIDVGRLADALPPTRRSAELLEHLASQQPDTYLPDLVVRMIAIRVMLAQTGQIEQAIETAYRTVQLTEQLGDGQLSSQVARLNALDHLVTSLTAMNRPGDAIEPARDCVAVAERLAADNPAFRHSLAKALDQLATALDMSGQLAESVPENRRSVTIYERLAVEEPDRYRPEYAMTSMRLGLRLEETGEPEAALGPAHRAVEVFERLAAEDPQTYRPQFALALHNLIAPLSSSGRLEAALRTARQVVQIRDELAPADPNYGVDLGYSLNNLAILLGDVDNAEAISCAQRAVTILEPLAAADDRHLDILARTLETLANRLDASGFHAESVVPARRSVACFEKLAAARPYAHSDDLARALTNLSNKLSANLMHDEALMAAHRAVIMFEQLAASQPGAYTKSLGFALHTLGARLAVLGRLAEALDPAQRAVDIFDHLATAHPSVHAGHLATALDNLARMHRNLGQHQHAAVATRRAEAARRMI